VGAWKTGVAVGLPIHYGKDDAGDLLEMGKALVVLYQPPNDIIGVEQPFSVELAGLPPIEGRIDVIRREGEDLILADLKTSGTKVVADTHAVEAQLGLYNIAYPATKHEIIVLGKLKTPTINTQNIIPWSVGKVHQHYTEIHHAMVHHVRYAVRGWQCVGCSFHNRCQKDKS